MQYPLASCARSTTKAGVSLELYKALTSYPQLQEREILQLTIINSIELLHYFITMTTPYEDSPNDMEDVRDLCQRRGTRRGQITRIEHYFEARDKTLLNHLSLTELTRKRDSLLELIKEHETIQCRIEQVESGEELDSESAEVLRMCDTHDRCHSKIGPPADLVREDR